MEDIYEKLSRHFLGEATPEQEEDVARFKKEKTKEYNLLYLLWSRRGEIHVRDFDSVKAWKKLTTDHPGEVVPFYRQLTRMAAAAAILLLFAVAIYSFIKPSAVNKVVVHNNSEGAREIQLPDGSKVWLNKNASLVYPETFNGDPRNVKLSGEAFFDVVKDPQNPFNISTIHSEVTVMGTSFNVNASLVETRVSVATGLVKVTSLKSRNSVIVPFNHSAVATDETVTSSSTVEPNYQSWKSGAFEFDDTPIRQVVKDLNSYYNQEIVIDDAGALTCTLTARFNGSHIDEVLEVIRLTCDVDVTERDGRYVLKSSR